MQKDRKSNVRALAEARMEMRLSPQDKALINQAASLRGTNATAFVLASALTVYLTNYTDVRELHIFAAVMVVQSLPFLFAVALATLERLPRRTPKLKSQDGNKVVDRPLTPVPAPVQQAARIAVAHPLALHVDEQGAVSATRSA